MPKRLGYGGHKQVLATMMDSRLTSSEILRGKEDFHKLALDVHSHHFLAFTVAPEVCIRHTRGREQQVACREQLLNHV